MESNVITLVGTAITSLCTVVTVVITYNLKKDQKSHEIQTLEKHELNRKMHDRLVETEEAIRRYEPIPDKTRLRLLLNTSRLAKYDMAMINDVDHLLHSWHLLLYQRKKSILTLSEQDEQKFVLIEMIKSMRKKVDSLVVKA